MQTPTEIGFVLTTAIGDNQPAQPKRTAADSFEFGKMSIGHSDSFHASCPSASVTGSAPVTFVQGDHYARRRGEEGLFVRIKTCFPLLRLPFRHRDECRRR